MRSLAILTAVVLLATPVAVSAAPESRKPCTTTTSLGAVAGRVADGLCVYRGVPYAEPPTGDLRFRPPRPTGPWRGAFQATDNSKVCPQFRDDQSVEYPDDRDVYTDEDCLRLNVWAPRAARDRPVVVFVHGGAARFGSGNEPRYDGAKLAETGEAVVVTLNYRLGLLGWAELGGLDPAYRGSANNGLRDQIAAFEWIRSHIADFGGDPANVTAVGESEGAFSLSALLATDNPQRLFRRVVLQSGNGYMIHTPEYQRALDARLEGTTVDALKAMEPVELLAFQERLAGPDPVRGAVYFGPSIDGDLVKAPLIDRVRAGHARGIDLLVGSNRDEIRFFAQFDPNVLEMSQRDYDPLFPRELAARRDEVIRTYRRERPGQSEADITLAMLTDQAMRVPATRLAQEQSRWARTYAYQFDWAPAGGLGAVHTAELPFVFGTLSFTGIPGGAEAYRADPGPVRRLAGRMTRSWTLFARFGHPGWPQYRFGRATKIWNTPATLAFAPREAERAAWDGFDFPALTVNG